MKNLIKRVNYVMDGEDGTSSEGIVIWISVVLIVATVLYLSKNTVIVFFKRVIDCVNNR